MNFVASDWPPVFLSVRLFALSHLIHLTYDKEWLLDSMGNGNGCWCQEKVPKRGMRNLPTVCHKTSLLYNGIYIMDCWSGRKWSLTCRMLCAHSMGAPIPKKKHYHPLFGAIAMLHYRAMGDFLREDHSTATNRQTFLDRWALPFKGLRMKVTVP